MQDADRSVIRVGSRKSHLALVQTHLAINSLKQTHPHLDFEVITISTTGDKILDVALSKIGDKSLFTKELEVALLNHQVDLVVHSLKDVPTLLPDKLVLGCVFNRVSPEDVVLMAPCNRGLTLSSLPPGSIVGTSSLRRTAILSREFPKLKFVSIRGNLNTRLSKLDKVRPQQDSGDQSQDACTNPFYDAIILAKAGVERLGWSDRIDQVLDKNYYAVGQGALTCECRRDDLFILNLLQSLHDEKASLGCIAERSLMRHLDGGCSTPIGVRSSFKHNSIDCPTSQTLEANILSLDGSKCVHDLSTIDLPQCVPSSESYDSSSGDNGANLEAPHIGDVNVRYSQAYQLSVDEIIRICCKRSPLKKRQNFSSAFASLERSTDSQRLLINDPNAIFMGILVIPSTPLKRLRMLKAQELGRDLAHRLLDVHHGRALLDEIRFNAMIKH